VWILCRDDGSVETGHCTCMAGAGKVCSHVGAVLFALEYINTEKTTTSCTDVRALWKIPKVSKVEYQSLKRMDFGRIIACHKLAHQTIPQIGHEEMVDMLRDIQEGGSSSVLLRVVEPFASTFETVKDPVQNLYKELYKKEYEVLQYDELLQIATQTKATMWGINHEDNALSAYKEYSIPFHEGLRVEKVGLWLNPRYPQFGGSSDGMVFCECCGRGCIEVKCPFY
jgi:hypothetical protein